MGNKAVLLRPKSVAMPTPVLKEIRIYPIKSLGGISLPEAVIEEKGLRYDRRWMLVKPGEGGSPGEFITQRTYAVMALIDVELTPEHLRVYHRHRPDDVLEIGLNTQSDERLDVIVWDDTVAAAPVSAGADQWFSRVMGFPCRLVRMPEETRRPVDSKYAQLDDIVSFADAYPCLLVSEESLQELNRRLAEPLSMIRFRPNLIVEGTLPYEEDTWYRFRIGSHDFYGVKPCARCVLTTIDPETGQKGKEPLRTLATYRSLNNKIYFGQNAIPAAVGRLRVGEPVEVIERREARLPFP